MAAPTRAEVEAELTDVESQLRDALVPDGRTGLTSLSLGSYREALRKRRGELNAMLSVFDAQGGLSCGCSVREY